MIIRWAVAFLTLHIYKYYTTGAIELGGCALGHLIHLDGAANHELECKLANLQGIHDQSTDLSSSVRDFNFLTNIYATNHHYIVYHAHTRVYLSVGTDSMNVIKQHLKEGTHTCKMHQRNIRYQQQLPSCHLIVIKFLVLFYY